MRRTSMICLLALVACQEPVRAPAAEPAAKPSEVPTKSSEGEKKPSEAPPKPSEPAAKPDKPASSAPEPSAAEPSAPEPSAAEPAGAPDAAALEPAPPPLDPNLAKAVAVQAHLACLGQRPFDPKGMAAARSALFAAVGLSEEAFAALRPQIDNEAPWKDIVSAAAASCPALALAQPTVEAPPAPPPAEEPAAPPAVVEAPSDEQALDLPDAPSDEAPSGAYDAALSIFWPDGVAPTAEDDEAPAAVPADDEGP